MNRKALKDNELYRHSDTPEQERPIEIETDKRGQRHGGMDKKGKKEKDIKGNFNLLKRECSSKCVIP